MVFLPPPSPSPKPSIGKGILDVVGITYVSGVPTIVGAEENDEPASMLSSFPLSCLHMEQAVKPQSTEVDQKSFKSGATYLLPQNTDKGEK